MPSKMKVVHSDVVTIRLLTRSADTKFQLHYICIKSDDVLVFSYYVSPAVLALMGLVIFLMVVLCCAILPLSVWQFRKLRREQEQSMEESIVVRRANMQRHESEQAQREQEE